MTKIGSLRVHWLDGLTTTTRDARNDSRTIKARLHPAGITTAATPGC